MGGERVPEKVPDVTDVCLKDLVIRPQYRLRRRDLPRVESFALPAPMCAHAPLHRDTWFCLVVKVTATTMMRPSSGA